MSTDPAEVPHELRAAATLPKPRVITHERNVTLETLRALSHPLRLELISHIAARGPICTCHMMEALPYTQPTISKHLAVLRQAGLITARREGRWTYYSVDATHLDAAREFLNDLHDAMHRPHLADKCS